MIQGESSNLSHFESSSRIFKSFRECRRVNPNWASDSKEVKRVLLFSLRQSAGSNAVTWLQAAANCPIACHSRQECFTGTKERAKVYALNPTPYNPHSNLTPYTLHPTSYNLNPTPYTLHPTPCTLHPAPCTLHPAPYTSHPKHRTTHHTPYTLNPAFKTVSTRDVS